MNRKTRKTRTDDCNLRHLEKQQARDSIKLGSIAGLEYKGKLSKSCFWILTSYLSLVDSSRMNICKHHRFPPDIIIRINMSITELSNHMSQLESGKGDEGI